MTRTYGIVDIVSFLLLLLVNLCSCDINKDNAECDNQLFVLTTYLPYVSGEAKAPTLDCCIGLKQVLKDSKKCLCILVKDRNDPSLGLKVNSTLALSIPKTCHVTSKDNVTECFSKSHNTVILFVL
ncbi:Protein YLS3 [Bienertia sinuspersici]